MCAVTIPEGPGRGGDGMSDFDRFVGVWELDGIEDFLEGKRGPPAGFERSSGLLFYLPTGELVGPVPMLLTSLACLSLFCVVAGSLFVVATRMYEQECAVSARVAASSAYLLEAAGSAFGGILASIVLLRFLESFQIAIVVALLNLCMAAVLLFRMARKQLGAVTVADRKSTRLNSSHLGISYAVF